jgi:hypothetical protein
MSADQKNSNDADLFLARDGVLDCGRPLPLWQCRTFIEKRWRAGAVQNLAVYGLPLPESGFIHL